jgi:hypothetical protein
MSKVIDLAERLETWKSTYDNNGIQVSVSSRGRFRFCVGGQITFLDMVDSVDFLGRISEELERQMGVLFEEEPAEVVKIR